MELLPEACIASILSRTTPKDACRLSLVSKTFCSAADSDTVWDRFLPSDSHSIVSEFPSLANAPSKKALYLALSDDPVIIDEGKKSFQLDRKNGKKRYMLGARDLSISLANDERHWCWKKLPESRFPEVAELLLTWWLLIIGRIKKNSLTPNTQYGAFLVFKMVRGFKFYDYPVVLSVGIVGGHSINKRVNLCLESLEDEAHDQVERLPGPSVRRDEWLEIEIGEFSNSGLEDEVIEMRVMEINGFIKSSLIIEGIKVRPKEDN
ncbi:F-box protein PP2-B11-like [Lotus japonicus]|uniref:F-box protein PP2-B11-like n=1 Tax=Lotus japonicus TaxID=34305 RepID=UPI00258618AB|nr:F-box protein PP2-B11-like [Lotus japonicus]